LPPTMPWLDSIPPAAPVLKINTTDDGVVLKWETKNPQKEPLRYVVYRFNNKEAINLERTDRILSIQQGTDYTDADTKHNKQCSYIVTALDRSWNESKPSNKMPADIKKMN